MHEAVISPLAAWESFYVIVGSSAAALTGLQFVVMALVADAPRRPAEGEIAAFGTPTIVYFCAVLLVSAVVSAPWSGLHGAALVLTAIGLFGVAYTVLVALRARRQTGYKPVFEDWVWHVGLPFTAQTLLAIGALAMVRYDTSGLFLIAGASLLLLFIGIHNAWDTVTYIAVNGPFHGGTS